MPAVANAPAPIQIRRRDRLLARLRGTTLDRRLAAGVPPESEAPLAVRALALHGARTKLADSVGRLAAEARRPRRPSPSVRMHGARGEAVAKALEALGEDLRGPEPVATAGLAQLHLFLTDGTGPLWDRARAGEVVPALARVRSALEP